MRPCSTEASRHQQRGRGHRRLRPAGTEAEDLAGFGEALLRRGPAPPTTRQRTSLAQPRPDPADNEWGDFPRSAEAPPAGNETEDITGSAEALPRCQQGRATQKTRKSRTR